VVVSLVTSASADTAPQSADTEKKVAAQLDVVKVASGIAVDGDGGSLCIWRPGNNAADLPVRRNPIDGRSAGGLGLVRRAERGPDAGRAEWEDGMWSRSRPASVARHRG
jgi:hypothetical protein